MSKLFRMLTAVILFAVVVQGAFAQTSTPTPNPTPITWTTDEAEIVGVLEAIDLSSVTVSGIVIGVSGADVETGITIGDTVRVRATLIAGLWQAREAESVMDDDDDNASVGEFEITGVLTATGSGFIIVAGQIIDVSTAEFNDTLTLGDLVKAHVTNVNGQFIAREVERAFTDAPTCATVTPDGWRTYRIRSGDTLSEIAARAGTPVAELARVNCITDTRIVVAGTLLFVPRVGSGDIGNDNGNDDNGNDDNGNDDNGNDDNGNDDNGNDDDDNGNDDNGNDDDDNGNDDNGNDDDDNGNDDDDNGNDDDDNGNDDDDNGNDD